MRCKLQNDLPWYPDEEYQRVRGYLRHIKDLPQNGSEVS